LPPEIEGREFLKKAGDTSGKKWDEEGLRRWEAEVNGGDLWPGRD
jgi:putative ATPase